MVAMSDLSCYLHAGGCRIAKLNSQAEQIGCARRAHPSCKSELSAASVLVAAFTAAGVDPERVTDAETLDRAVEVAAEWACPGDTVLLSPGCASLDQFANFEVRGDSFRQLVAEITEPDAVIDIQGNAASTQEASA